MLAPARAVSHHILLQVATTDAHSDELLRSREVDRLSPQDRNLVTTLVLGTLRWQLALDARIQPLLARPGMKLSPPVAAALRLGAYQLLYLDRIPPHAAIGESVELVKQSSDRHASGMVNAVLRKIATQPRPDSSQSTAAADAHPAWMVERWHRFYGASQTSAICRANQEPASVSVRLVDEQAEASLLDEGIGLAPGEFLSHARRVLRGDIARTKAFRNGLVRVQDEASQLVAEIAAAAVPGAQRILDTCAAPGGKTAILAERHPQAEITAYDINAKRLQAMRRLFVPGRVHFEVADASAMKLPSGYDLILCDVPCSGTGTIGRNPEIRFRVSVEEYARQRERQVAILMSSLAGLAPGGCLVYSTCSLEPEENEVVVEACLAKNAGFELLPVESLMDQLSKQGVLIDRLASTVSGGVLRTIPGVHACDGFFAAVFIRTQ